MSQTQALTIYIINLNSMYTLQCVTCATGGKLCVVVQFQPKSVSKPEILFDDLYILKLICFQNKLKFKNLVSV